MAYIVENNQFEQIGIIDAYRSSIWKRRYNEPGAFEIHVAPTSIYLSILKRGHYIINDKSDEVGVIERIEIKSNPDTGTIMYVSGRTLSCIFDRRYIAVPRTYDTTVESIMRDLVDKNCITTDSERVFPGLELGQEKGYTETAKAYAKGVLLEYLTKLSLTSNIGFRVHKNGSVLTFETYKGIDRSASQTDVPQVIFSEEFDNLESAEYLADDSTKVTAVHVLATDYYQNVQGEATGYERYETFVEIEPVTGGIIVNGNLVVGIDQNKTLAAMEQAANDAMNNGVENFTGTISHYGMESYQKEWDLGDIVTVRSDRWNIQTDVRIHEIHEVSDETGDRVIPIFGMPAPTILDLLSKY